MIGARRISRQLCSKVAQLQKHLPEVMPGARLAVIHLTFDPTTSVEMGNVRGRTSVENGALAS
jgi:hypothetical protein